MLRPFPPSNLKTHCFSSNLLCSCVETVLSFGIINRSRNIFLRVFRIIQKFFHIFQAFFHSHNILLLQPALIGIFNLLLHMIISLFAWEDEGFKNQTVRRLIKHFPSEGLTVCGILCANVVTSNLICHEVWC